MVLTDTGDAPARPLRAVDTVRVSHVDEKTRRIIATKRVDRTDPYLDGHFPALTIYPGVFVLESLRQAVSEALEHHLVIVAVRAARFRRPLLSDDVLRLDVTATRTTDGRWTATADATLASDIPPDDLLAEQRAVADTRVATLSLVLEAGFGD